MIKYKNKHKLSQREMATLLCYGITNIRNVCQGQIKESKEMAKRVSMLTNRDAEEIKSKRTSWKNDPARNHNGKMRYEKTI